MRKLTKSIVCACAAATVLSSVAIVAHAYQATTSWGTHIDFWTDTLSSGITEKDSDTVSHVTWSGREANYDFKLKFTVQSADNADVCDQIYVDSATQLGKVVTIYNSNCIKDRKYNLVSARENLFDSAVYCTGNWEP